MSCARTNHRDNQIILGENPEPVDTTTSNDKLLSLLPADLSHIIVSCHLIRTSADGLFRTTIEVIRDLINLGLTSKRICREWVVPCGMMLHPFQSALKMIEYREEWKHGHHVKPRVYAMRHTLRKIGAKVSGRGAELRARLDTLELPRDRFGFCPVRLSKTRDDALYAHIHESLHQGVRDVLCLPAGFVVTTNFEAKKAALKLHGSEHGIERARSTESTKRNERRSHMIEALAAYALHPSAIEFFHCRKHVLLGEQHVPSATAVEQARRIHFFWTCTDYPDDVCKRDLIMNDIYSSDDENFSRFRDFFFDKTHARVADWNIDRSMSFELDEAMRNWIRRRDNGFPLNWRPESVAMVKDHLIASASPCPESFAPFIFHEVTNYMFDKGGSLGDFVSDIDSLFS
jgi:hypothetical protein